MEEERVAAVLSEERKPVSVKWERYHLPVNYAPDVVKVPPQFIVQVRKLRLIKMVIKEIFKYGFDFSVALSRPCVYGVFSRPVGGLAPIHEKCVGCLRCTMQYPDVVSIIPNPEWFNRPLPFLSPQEIIWLLYEARTGRIPVRGAGYTGKFGGSGWDSLWTDMSEIVRPTRDGIHGREYISTATDIGYFPPSLKHGKGNFFTIEVPIIFDEPPPGKEQHKLARIFLRAAKVCKTVCVIPATILSKSKSQILPDDFTNAILLILTPEDIERSKNYIRHSKAVFTGSPELAIKIKELFPEKLTGIKTKISNWQNEAILKNFKLFWFYCNYDGYDGEKFIKDYLIDIHKSLSKTGIRSSVTVIVSGGINTAEHLPKALLCGANATVVNLPLWIALNASVKLNQNFQNENGEYPMEISFPSFREEWAVQRIVNMVNAWRDQLLEVSGAMGIRDTRRMTGEHGRLILQEIAEKEAFSGIEGFPD